MPFLFILIAIMSFSKHGYTAALAIDVNQYMNSDKIKSWGKDGVNRIADIERFIRIFHQDLTLGKITANAVDKLTCDNDTKFSRLRFWPSAKSACADKQYTKLVTRLKQYDADQLKDKDKIIERLKLVMEMLRALNDKLRKEKAELEGLIENELEDMIQRYMRYVARADTAMDAHSAGLTRHTTELNRLLDLIKGGKLTRGLIADITDAQADAGRLLTEAQNASAAELARIDQEIEHVKSITKDAKDVFTSYKKQIDALTKEMGARAPA